ncbi:hypothetical protein KIL84_006070 [Mauremys mutica]|uniref:Uncharacterized protein n=1 Tax=Mauremys mutica TaxID=74926 RepID=A0A9D3XJ57_9SAUR|nr:hypothetical protein KIL84_006070 [Mauremys mutica]
MPWKRERGQFGVEWFIWNRSLQTWRDSSIKQNVQKINLSSARGFRAAGESSETGCNRGKRPPRAPWLHPMGCGCPVYGPSRGPIAAASCIDPHPQGAGRRCYPHCTDGETEAQSS